MIGIVVLSHAQMAKGMQSATDLIIGHQSQYEARGYQEGQDYDEFVRQVAEAISTVNAGDGVLVLCDLFGASPYNSVAKNMSQLRGDGVNVRVVTGVSLPMLIEALTMREGMSLEELYKDVIQVAKEGMVEMLESLGL